MRQRYLFLILVFAAAVVALMLRLPRLQERPLHGDEANQVVRTGILLETGEYLYDPAEHHGPTLYYLTLPVLWTSGARTLAETEAWQFRIVPLVFGIILVLLPLLMSDGLGRSGAIAAALLTAVSPAMVFYSRYYIQETLLLVFTLAAIASAWRYWRTRRLYWAACAGLGIGLMFATKETCVFLWAGMAAGCIPLWLSTPAAERPARRDIIRASAIGLAAAFVIAALFFTSFFTNPRGLLDSILAYTNYVDRAGGVEIHRHPWHFYLAILLYVHRDGGPYVSEAAILLLAAWGAVVAFRQPVGKLPHLLPRFFAVYTLVVTIAFCAIPYKTPWNLLPFLSGMTVLAGFGAAQLLTHTRTSARRVIVGLLLSVILAHLAWEARVLTSRRLAADWRNPYVYAHTMPQIVRLEKRAEELAAVHPKGHDMRIHVIATGADYWPLPWYLRRFAHIGYWAAVPEHPDADLIIASPDLYEALQARLKQQYTVEFHGLRPDKMLQAYIRKDLWDAFLRTREATQ